MSSGVASGKLFRTDYFFVMVTDGDEFRSAEKAV